MWVGHVVLAVRDVAKTKQFLLALGLRDAEPAAPVGVVELRGGTHILVLPRSDDVAPGTRAPFDLMVDDLDAFRARLEGLGIPPAAVQTNPSHRFFLLREPGGHDIAVSSSHATGLPV
jgi:catechol 2,3-dioxygenase-like lactoylglutathione lyase family enzyme